MRSDEIIYKESRFLFETTLKAIQATDTKAATLLGFSAVLAGIYIGVGQYITETVGIEYGIFFFIGCATLFISAIFSLRAYRTRLVALGPEGRDLIGLIIDQMKESGIAQKKRMIRKLSITYINCVEYNRWILKSKADMIKKSLSAILMSILFILGGPMIVVIIT